MVDRYGSLGERIRRANARAEELAVLLRAAGVAVSSVEEATFETDAAVNVGENRHVQVGVDGTYTIVGEEGEGFIFEEPITSATEIVNALVEELHRRTVAERVKINPPQVFHCDKCGLFNPVAHFKAQDVEGMLKLLAGRETLDIQLSAAECPRCGAWVSPMERQEVEEIAGVARRADAAALATLFENIGLIVTENTADTATAQVAVVVKHRRIDETTVEANFACAPGVVERGGSLQEAVRRLLERSLLTSAVAEGSRSNGGA